MIFFVHLFFQSYKNLCVCGKTMKTEKHTWGIKYFISTQAHTHTRQRNSSSLWELILWACIRNNSLNIYWISHWDLTHIHTHKYLYKHKGQCRHSKMRTFWKQKKTGGKRNQKKKRQFLVFTTKALKTFELAYFWQDFLSPCFGTINGLTLLCVTYCCCCWFCLFFTLLYLRLVRLNVSLEHIIEAAATLACR